MTYLKNFSTRETPQLEPIPGSSQVQNSAGGFSWAVDKWVRLDRFLILGSEGGSYYATEQKLTRENAQSVLECIAEDGIRTVKRIVDVSQRGLAPKNDPALFALALCSAAPDLGTRKFAFDHLRDVARIGTHILHFVQFMEQFRRWGRGARSGVGRWFLDQDPRDLAYQAIKYQSRDGWALSDLLRLSHPKTEEVSRKVVFDWIVNGWSEVGEDQHPDETLLSIWAFERAKRATKVSEIVRLIENYKLPREAVPTQFLNEKEVWSALLESMPLEAMVRNLGKMSSIGLLLSMSRTSSIIQQRLQDRDRIRKSRLHPIKLLTALLTYSRGAGVRGSLSWRPVSQVIDALDHAFYLAFDNIEKTGKRYCLALDISGSMGGGEVAGVPGLTPRVASAALSLVTANVESNHYIMGFGDQFHSLNISPRQRLDDAVRAVSGLPFGGTDCSLPMVWALEWGIEIDNFVVYTDSETWAGRIHSSQALVQYREKTGINAKLAVVGMVANNFTIADPNDSGMMDVVGFSTDTPAVMGWFFS